LRNAFTNIRVRIGGVLSRRRDNTPPIRTPSRDAARSPRQYPRRDHAGRNDRH
jgi:hypothetical protein